MQQTDDVTNLYHKSLDDTKHSPTDVAVEDLFCRRVVHQSADTCLYTSAERADTTRGYTIPLGRKRHPAVGCPESRHLYPEHVGH